MMKRIIKKNWTKLVLTTIASGLSMWIIGGLWHNLVLPSVNENIHPHHEGLGITLLAYIILAMLMQLVLVFVREHEYKLWYGLVFGATIGLIWVFPHGLSMAAIHHTPIIYEFKNALYHLFEQGIGGLILYRSYNH